MTLGLRVDGSVVSTDASFLQNNASELKNVIAITTNEYRYALAVRSDGTVHYTGDGFAYADWIAFSYVQFSLFPYQL
jgi:hypothetical protein